MDCINKYFIEDLNSVCAASNYSADFLFFRPSKGVKKYYSVNLSGGGVEKIFSVTKQKVARTEQLHISRTFENSQPHSP